MLIALAALLPGAAAAAGPPEIEASWVTDVTATSANLRAAINAAGTSTSYRFEYVAEAAYEKNGFSGAAFAPPSGAAPLGSGTTAISVAQAIAALVPTTSYLYRVRATNGTDTVLSAAHILTTRAASNSFALPDHRAWELVSAPDKGGGAVAEPEALFGGGLFQAGAETAAFTYSSASAFAAPAGAPPVSQYLARRDPSGWSSENISAPLRSGAYGDHPDGAPYRLLSDDLSRALLFGGLSCRGALPGCPSPNPVLAESGAPAGFMAFYLRDGATRSFSSLLSAADLSHSAVAPDSFAVSALAATPDLATVVLSSCAALTAVATEVLTGPGECDPAAQNLYRWSAAGLEALNIEPGQIQSTPGAALAARIGALSSDGDRAYFNAPEDGPLYLREAGALTKLLPESSPGAEFQGASSDGSIAFFSAGAELYRYDAATEASSPVAANVAGVLAVSGDGSRVYFQDAGGLELWHLGHLTQIASGPDVAVPSDYPPTSSTARLSPDGLHLAFLSAAAIPPFDNLDADSGEADTELYLYGPLSAGAAPSLICVSCNPTGERPRGSASIPGSVHNGSTALYRPRALSEDGTRVLFTSSDGLVLRDTDSRPDLYQWEARGVGSCEISPGCLDLLSGGRQQGATFLDASADGSDVYFLTADSLLGSDPGSLDVYDARVGGGLPEPQEPIACLADACQPLPSPPEDPAPASLIPNSGNPPPHFFKPRRRQRHHRRRRGHPHRRPAGRGPASEGRGRGVSR